MLNDWDFAGSTKELGQGIGTWAFMSIGLLDDPDKLHDVEDDLEAVFWVLLYCALKRFAPPCPSLPISAFADQWEDINGRLVGGYEKLTLLQRRFYKDVEFRSPAFRNMIHDMAETWKTYHLSLSGTEASTAELTRELKRVNSLAPKPSFWVEKVSNLLSQFPDTVAPEKPVQMSGATLPPNGTKRKASSLEKDDTALPGPRRSKRLKVLREA